MNKLVGNKKLRILGAIALACTLFLLVSSEARASVASEDLAITRITELALKENPLIAAAVERTNQARARVSRAKSGFGPKIDVGVSATQVEDAPVAVGIGTVTAGPGAGSPVRVNIPLGYEETYKAAVSLWQTLFSGGTLTANLRAAELELEAALAEETRTRQAVLDNVQVSYFTVQRGYGRLTVAEENLKISREHLKQVDSFFRAGFVAMNEVLRVKVSIAQAEQEKINAENAIRIAVALLQRAVGVPLPTTIADEKRETPPRLELEGDRTSLALQVRPELAALKASRLAAEQTAIAYAGQRLPQVYLSGEMGRVDDDFFPSGDDEWQVNMVLQWRLFDSGEIRSWVNEARAVARELLNLYKDLENQVVQEVTSASSNLEAAMARINVAREQVANAKEDYRMAVLRYENQVGTNLDVLDSQAALITALNSLVDAVYDASIAESRVVFAVGQGKLVF